MAVLGEQKLAAELMRIPGLELFPDEPLARHTRFALGGPARLLIDATTPASLSHTLLTLHGSGHPYLLIGGGTNLIVADGGFDGIVLRFRSREVRVEGPRMIAGAGAELEDVVDTAIATSLAGVECLKRIPGWVGAAIYGNAGAYGQQISDRLTTVAFHDGDRVRHWSREACGFRYRWSEFKLHPGWVILEACFEMTPGDRNALAARAEEIRAIRDEKFPPTLRCAGSIFKNFVLASLPTAVQDRVPPGLVKGGKVPAAWFLEQVGAKGLSRGGIHVADYHANLIFNDGKGLTSELLDLIDELKSRVLNEFTIPLEEEVQYVGFDHRTSY
jgi:UDP-N-acetylmuramate dehydrogenase